MKFADIPGHSDIKRDLAQMVDSGRLPHALLLEGPEGCGKFALARALAQYINFFSIVMFALMIVFIGTYI